MHPSEVTGFSSTDYRERITKKLPHQLIYDIYKKRRALTTSSVGVVFGVLCAASTGGMSLVGTSLCARTRNVAKRKLNLLEQEWHRREGGELPDRYVKDVLIPLLISTTIGTFTFSVDVGLSNACVDSAIAATFSQHTGLPAELFPEKVIGAACFVVEQVAAEIGKKINDRL